jgi:hypothetical protein
VIRTEHECLGKESCFHRLARAAHRSKDTVLRELLSRNSNRRSRLVWQKVWEEAKDSIMALYRASLRLRHLPDSWRTARIVPLRKPGKPDYTVPKAFRPISLLATISKGLDNHFGARKKRSCEQAINVLVERVYEAWRNRKVVSLVTFDVQGAFNGVNPRVLETRLEQRGIPETLSS